MERPLMEVIRFDADDVIATSAPGPVVTGHVLSGDNLTCPNGHGPDHFKVLVIGDLVRGNEYYTHGGSFYVYEDVGVQAFDFAAAPTNEDIGKWYYADIDTGWQYILCGSGQ